MSAVAGDLFLIDGARTPFVRAGGAFAGLDGDELGRLALLHLLQGRDELRRDCEGLALGLDRVEIAAVDPARRLALRAGLAPAIPAATLAAGPGSGLGALVRLLETRDGGGPGLFILGGQASSSRNLGLEQGLDRPGRRRFEPRATGLVDDHEGTSLVQLADILAGELEISRRELDEVAFMSRRRARQAAARRRKEIAPVVTSTELIDDDRGALADEDLAWLGRLKPLLGRNGRATAGQGQILADGAAMLLLGRERRLGERYGARARIVEALVFAGPPRRPQVAVLGALREILDRCRLGIDDIDLFEIHESFAADLLALPTISGSSRLWRRFGLAGEAPGSIETDRINAGGGAIALGHAGAASGPRMLLALARELENRGGRRGLALMAAGGGQASAIVIERP